MHIYSPFTHGYMVRTGVENLKIVSDVSKGIDVSTLDPDGDLVGLHFSNLTISTGGEGIDMRGKDIYQSTVENVTFVNMGSTALAMTWYRPAGNTAINYIHNVVITGLARSNFVAEDCAGDPARRLQHRRPGHRRRRQEGHPAGMREGRQHPRPGDVHGAARTCRTACSRNSRTACSSSTGSTTSAPAARLQFINSSTTVIRKVKLANNATVNNGLLIDSASACRGRFASVQHADVACGRGWAALLEQNARRAGCDATHRTSSWTPRSTGRRRSGALRDRLRCGR